MKMEIERAEQFYRGGSILFELLEPDGRRIFGLMTDTYHELLTRIENCPTNVFQHRVRLSLFAKVKNFTRWMLFPPRLKRLT